MGLRVVVVAGAVVVVDDDVVVDDVVVLETADSPDAWLHAASPTANRTAAAVSLLVGAWWSMIVPCSGEVMPPV
jgi:hypothetical protein